MVCSLPSFRPFKAKQKYRGMFETKKSRNKTSSEKISLIIRTLASPNVGQDQVSEGVSVLCWHVKESFPLNRYFCMYLNDTAKLFFRRKSNSHFFYFLKNCQSDCPLQSEMLYILIYRLNSCYTWTSSHGFEWNWGDVTQHVKMYVGR